MLILCVHFHIHACLFCILLPTYQLLSHLVMSALLVYEDNALLLFGIWTLWNRSLLNHITHGSGWSLLQIIIFEFFVINVIGMNLGYRKYFILHLCWMMCRGWKRVKHRQTIQYTTTGHWDVEEICGIFRGKKPTFAWKNYGKIHR